MLWPIILPKNGTKSHQIRRCSSHPRDANSTLTFPRSTNDPHSINSSQPNLNLRAHRTVSSAPPQLRETLPPPSTPLQIRPSTIGGCTTPPPRASPAQVLTRALVSPGAHDEEGGKKAWPREAISRWASLRFFSSLPLRILISASSLQSPGSCKNRGRRPRRRELRMIKDLRVQVDLHPMPRGTRA